MLEERKEEILDQNYVINKRKNVRTKKHFLATKNRCFLLGIIVAIVLSIALYISLPTSNVFKVIVKGNRYLSDDYYIKLSGIDDNSKYIFVNSLKLENKIKKDPIVETIKVKHLDHMLIEINVIEKEIIGYSYDDKPYLILLNGNKIEMTQDYLDMISKVPLIDGFDDEELKIIAPSFKHLNHEMLEQISEIHRFSFSYDDKTLEIIMRDGNYVYLAYYGLNLLNNYFAITSNLDTNGNRVCLFLDDMTNSGYISDCPYWKNNKELDEVLQ